MTFSAPLFANLASISRRFAKKAASFAAFTAASSLAFSGCGHHPLTDYRPLTKAGMSSASIEQLKKLDTSDAETLQLVTLKDGGISDNTCVQLVNIAHQHQQPFASADPVVSLAHASYGEPQILEIARLGKLESVSTDAVTLRLIGLQDSTVQTLLQRHLHDQPTLSSGEIARMKNVGLTEAEILQRINTGMTDDEAEKEVVYRATSRAHYGTGFTRVRGRRR
jgi:hypothetical protein